MATFWLIDHTVDIKPMLFILCVAACFEMTPEIPELGQGSADGSDIDRDVTQTVRRQHPTNISRSKMTALFIGPTVYVVHVSSTVQDDDLGSAGVFRVLTVLATTCNGRWYKISNFIMIRSTLSLRRCRLSG